MKDADTISGYIDYLIHKYLVTASIMCDNDVCQRPLVYNFDVFLNVQTFVMSNMQILIRTHYCPHYPDFFGFYHNPIRFFYHVIIFLLYQLLHLFRVLLFRLNTLCSYHSA